MRRLLCSLVVLGLSATGASAAGSAEQGKRLAQLWCSGCHAVEGAGTDMVPTFRTIANRPGRSNEYLVGWLSDPHPPMPQLQLSRQEIADLIAFLSTLRQH